MDVSFNSVLQNTRKYFQGVPAGKHADNPVHSKNYDRSHTYSSTAIAGEECAAALSPSYPNSAYLQRPSSRPISNSNRRPPGVSGRMIVQNVSPSPTFSPVAAIPCYNTSSDDLAGSEHSSGRTERSVYPQSGEKLIFAQQQRHASFTGTYQSPTITRYDSFQDRGMYNMDSVISNNRQQQQQQQPRRRVEEVDEEDVKYCDVNGSESPSDQLHRTSFRASPFQQSVVAAARISSVSPQRSYYSSSFQQRQIEENSAVFGNDRRTASRNSFPKAVFSEPAADSYENAVIRKRESPLDLSVKTVRQSADSTATGAEEHADTNRSNSEPSRPFEIRHSSLPQVPSFVLGTPLGFSSKNHHHANVNGRLQPLSSSSRDASSAAYVPSGNDARPKSNTLRDERYPQNFNERPRSGPTESGPRAHYPMRMEFPIAQTKCVAPPPGSNRIVRPGEEGRKRTNDGVDPQSVSSCKLPKIEAWKKNIDKVIETRLNSYAKSQEMKSNHSSESGLNVRNILRNSLEEKGAASRKQMPVIMRMQQEWQNTNSNDGPQLRVDEKYPHATWFNTLEPAEPQQKHQQRQMNCHSYQRKVTGAVEPPLPPFQAIPMKLNFLAAEADAGKKELRWLEHSRNAASGHWPKTASSTLLSVDIQTAERIIRNNEVSAASTANDSAATCPQPRFRTKAELKQLAVPQPLVRKQQQQEVTSGSSSKKQQQQEMTSSSSSKKQQQQEMVSGLSSSNGRTLPHLVDISVESPFKPAQIISHVSAETKSMPKLMASDILGPLEVGTICSSSSSSNVINDAITTIAAAFNFTSASQIQPSHSSASSLPSSPPLSSPLTAASVSNMQTEQQEEKGEEIRKMVRDKKNESYLLPNPESSLIRSSSLKSRVKLVNSKVSLSPRKQLPLSFDLDEEEDNSFLKDTCEQLMEQLTAVANIPIKKRVQKRKIPHSDLEVEKKVKRKYVKKIRPAGRKEQNRVDKVKTKRKPKTDSSLLIEVNSKNAGERGWNEEQEKEKKDDDKVMVVDSRKDELSSQKQHPTSSSQHREKANKSSSPASSCSSGSSSENEIAETQQLLTSKEDTKDSSIADVAPITESHTGNEGVDQIDGFMVGRSRRSNVSTTRLRIQNYLLEDTSSEEGDDHIRFSWRESSVAKNNYNKEACSADDSDDSIIKRYRKRIKKMAASEMKPRGRRRKGTADAKNKNMLKTKSRRVDEGKKKENKKIKRKLNKKEGSIVGVKFLRKREVSSSSELKLGKQNAVVPKMEQSTDDLFTPKKNARITKKVTKTEETTAKGKSKFKTTARKQRVTESKQDKGTRRTSVKDGKLSKDVTNECVVRQQQQEDTRIVSKNILKIKDRKKRFSTGNKVLAKNERQPLNKVKNKFAWAAVCSLLRKKRQKRFNKPEKSSLIASNNNLKRLRQPSLSSASLSLGYEKEEVDSKGHDQISLRSRRVLINNEKLRIRRKYTKKKARIEGCKKKASSTEKIKNNEIAPALKNLQEICGRRLPTKPSAQSKECSRSSGSYRQYLGRDFGKRKQEDKEEESDSAPEEEDNKIDWENALFRMPDDCVMEGTDIAGNCSVESVNSAGSLEINGINSTGKCEIKTTDSSGSFAIQGADSPSSRCKGNRKHKKFKYSEHNSKADSFENTVGFVHSVDSDCKKKHFFCEEVQSESVVKDYLFEKETNADSELNEALLETYREEEKAAARESIDRKEDRVLHRRSSIGSFNFPNDTQQQLVAKHISPGKCETVLHQRIRGVKQKRANSAPPFTNSFELPLELQLSYLKQHSATVNSGSAVSHFMKLSCQETIDHSEGGTIFKKRKIRTLRRKGKSSGFDYIRKKKKHHQLKEDDGQTEDQRKKQSVVPRTVVFKNVQDIQTEIKTWVVNKSIGETVLHRAARLGYPDVCVYCLENMGLCASAADNAGYTPLHVACSRDHLGIAKILLQHGSDINASAIGGVRPLHEAVDRGNVEMVRLLLAYGADPLLATYSGNTPLSIAEENDCEEMLNFLRLFLADLSGSRSEPWQFAGYNVAYKEDELGFDPLADVPEEEKALSALQFESGEMELPNLYHFSNEPGSDLWLIMSDLPSDIRNAVLMTAESEGHYLREVCGVEFEEKVCSVCFMQRLPVTINGSRSRIKLIKYTALLKTLLGIQTEILLF